MKRFLLIICVLYAQHIYAQGARKYVLFEHFTQASCGPCASQNPSFQDNILAKNYGKIHHIAYHTSWPGTDPMYSYNPTEIATRTSYYGVAGVPDMYMLGTSMGSPASVTQADVDNEASQLSPIEIKVSETSDGTTRNVTVKIYTIGTPPSGNLKLRTAVIEDPKNYASPPGSNGETYFPNVFRKMLPNTSGDTYTPANQGDSVTFNYSYTLDLANWDTTNIYVVAFVQNDASKEVINSSSTRDPSWEISSSDPLYAEGTTGNTTNFSAQINNIENYSENYRVKLVSVHPTDWAASFTLNSTTYTDSADVYLSGDSSKALTINVVPGATPALGKYTLSMQSLDKPSLEPTYLEFYVISGVTDLIISNSGARGDGNPGDASDWETDYIGGLNYAGNTSYATTNEKILIELSKENALTGVLNVYFNVGWTFPSLTDDLVNELEPFLDNGGNFFISGQDIGWELWGPNGIGTTITKGFYTDYLNCTYSADGTSSNSSLAANSSDAVFGGVSTSTISNYYGGSNSMYPDQITEAGTGQATFYYNADVNKKCGVRATNGTYKTFYLSVGLEMLADAAVKKEILKLTHDWFYGLVSTEDFDKAMVNLSLGQSFPNPAESVITIPIHNNISTEAVLKINDVQGKLVKIAVIRKGIDSAIIDISELKPGLYHYYIESPDYISNIQKLSIVR